MPADYKDQPVYKLFVEGKVEEPLDYMGDCSFDSLRSFIALEGGEESCGGFYLFLVHYLHVLLVMLISW